MSAGQSLRRGYAHGVTPITEYEYPPRTRPQELLRLVLTAALVVAMVALASDELASWSIARMLGTAWSAVSASAAPALHQLAGFVGSVR